MSYRMNTHTRSQSSVVVTSQIKYSQKIGITHTQSTSSGSVGSNNRSKTSINKLTTFLGLKPKTSCGYCKNLKKYNYVPSTMNKYLYLKYSSSQNYYYTRDINEILTNARTKAAKDAVRSLGKPGGIVK